MGMQSMLPTERMIERENRLGTGDGRLSVAVGIPTYNRGHVLQDTLRQILSQEPAADEVIVVDQSDWYPNGAKKELERLVAEGAIRYFYQKTPNLPAARNRILAESKSDIVIFIDDDVVLSPGFVKQHLRNYCQPDVWAVGGRVTEAGIRPKTNAPRNWRKVLDYRYFDRASEQRVDDFGSFRGCNHSVRRSIAIALGGYDETFTGVALREESDLALRIVSAGGRIVFDPAASLHHLRAPGGGCRTSVWGETSAAAGALRFALKHRRLLGAAWWTEVWHAYRLGVVNRRTVRNPGVLVARHVWLLRELWRLARAMKSKP